MGKELDAIRERIDAVDDQIRRLINERAGLAQEVARVKLAAGDEALFYRPEREAQVLRKVKERNEGPLSDEEMARLFRELMSACLALEKPMQIAFLGPEGTFTQAAALKHFGHSVNTVPMGAIDEEMRPVAHQSGARADAERAPTHRTDLRIGERSQQGRESIIGDAHVPIAEQDDIAAGYF